MEFDKIRIEEAIIKDVAQKLIHEDVLLKKIRDEVSKKIDVLFKEQADVQIKSAINEAIRNGFNREYSRLTPWGEKEGPKTSIRAELEKLISGYWNEQVDANGKPSAYGAKLTRAEWHMAQMCATDFKGEMKQHVLDVAGGLKDGLRRELHGTVNKLLSEIFQVSSLDDSRN